MVGDDDVDAIAARSDPEAFGRLYHRHRVAVFRYLRARGVGEEDASDLAALTFERALARIDRFRPGGTGFLAWLFVIARNAAIDAHRRRTVAGRFAFMAREPEWGPSAEDLVIRDETDRLLAEHIRSLPPQFREVIILRFAAGLTAREIGQVLDRTEAASAKLVGRAVAALKEAYRDEPR